MKIIKKMKKSGFPSFHAINTSIGINTNFKFRIASRRFPITLYIWSKIPSGLKIKLKNQAKTPE